jgi:hypothetical protein
VAAATRHERPGARDSVDPKQRAGGRPASRQTRIRSRSPGRGRSGWSAIDRDWAPLTGAAPGRGGDPPKRRLRERRIRRLACGREAGRDGEVAALRRRHARLPSRPRREAQEDDPKRAGSASPRPVIAASSGRGASRRPSSSRSSCTSSSRPAFRGSFAAKADAPVRLPLPVEAFLLADPFVAAMTFLSTHTVYRGSSGASACSR